MGQKNERRMTMKVVNPVGRKVSTNVEANYDAQPRACMCNNGFTFSSGMGYNDNCNHCGYKCWPWNAESNHQVAKNTNRATTVGN